MLSIFFHTKYRQVLQIVGLCLTWYAVSSAMGIVGKILLSDFPYPMTVTMVQLLSITVYLIPILKNFVKTSDTLIPYSMPLRYWFQMILPLAFGKFVSSVSSHISIWKVPVSYAHTVKATMPFFTVVLSRVILRERQTKKVYISLIPIICGVIIASLTELSFDMIGLVSALVSTVGFALQNIFSKKCLKDTSLHQFSLLFTLAFISGILFFPLWVFYDLTRIMQDTSLSHSIHLPRLIALLIIDGFCNFAQNLVAFSIIALVTPLSYAVANCTKRVAVISVSLFILGNPVTFVNVIGMTMAIFGVLLYNKAKYDQHHEAKLLPVLPSYDVKSLPDASTNQLLIFDDVDHLAKASTLKLKNGIADSSYDYGSAANVNPTIPYSPNLGSNNYIIRNNILNDGNILRTNYPRS